MTLDIKDSPDLIEPDSELGVDAAGSHLITPEQEVNVAHALQEAIEAMDSGVELTKTEALGQVREISGQGMAEDITQAEKDAEEFDREAQTLKQNAATKIQEIVAEDEGAPEIIPEKIIPETAKTEPEPVSIQSQPPQVPPEFRREDIGPLPSGTAEAMITPETHIPGTSGTFEVDSGKEKKFKSFQDGENKIINEEKSEEKEEKGEKEIKEEKKEEPPKLDEIIEAVTEPSNAEFKNIKDEEGEKEAKKENKVPFYGPDTLIRTVEPTPVESQNKPEKRGGLFNGKINDYIKAARGLVVEKVKAAIDPIVAKRITAKIEKKEKGIRRCEQDEAVHTAHIEALSKEIHRQQNEVMPTIKHPKDRERIEKKISELVSKQVDRFDRLRDAKRMNESIQRGLEKYRNEREVVVKRITDRIDEKTKPYQDQFRKNAEVQQGVAEKVWNHGKKIQEYSKALEEFESNPEFKKTRKSELAEITQALKVRRTWLFNRQAELGKLEEKMTGIKEKLDYWRAERSRFESLGKPTFVESRAEEPKGVEEIKEAEESRTTFSEKNEVRDSQAPQTPEKDLSSSIPMPKKVQGFDSQFEGITKDISEQLTDDEEIADKKKKKVGKKNAKKDAKKKNKKTEKKPKQLKKKKAVKIHKLKK